MKFANSIFNMSFGPLVVAYEFRCKGGIQDKMEVSQYYRVPGWRHAEVFPMTWKILVKDAKTRRPIWYSYYSLTGQLS